MCQAIREMIEDGRAEGRKEERQHIEMHPNLDLIQCYSYDLDTHPDFMSSSLMDDVKTDNLFVAKFVAVVLTAFLPCVILPIGGEHHG